MAILPPYFFKSIGEDSGLYRGTLRVYERRMYPLSTPNVPSIYP